EEKFAARPREQSRAPSMGLCSRRRGRNSHRDECLHQPNGQPPPRRRLPRRYPCGSYSGQAHGYTAPTWHGSKFGGTLHGFADVAKVISGPCVNGNRFALGGSQWADESHDSQNSSRTFGCQVLCIAKCMPRRLIRRPWLCWPAIVDTGPPTSSIEL